MNPISLKTESGYICSCHWLVDEDVLVVGGALPACVLHVVGQ
jgi:hypothetical protein